MPPLQAQVTRPEGWWTVTVPMAERDRVKAEAAAGNISAFLRNAATIFDMINTGISSGFFLDDRYIAALTETCARAFENMADKEGAAMDDLQRALLQASGQKPPADGEAA